MAFAMLCGMNSQGSIGNKLTVKDTFRSGVVLSGTAKVRHCSLLLGDVEIKVIIVLFCC